MEYTEEIWKDIEGYEGYQVSSYGRVKNKRGKITFGVKGDKDGYLRITLTKNNIQKTYKVHRLVAIAFIPNPDNKPFIDHINTEKTDNRVENLRWCTSKENNNNPITKIKMGKAKKGFKHTDECKKRMSEIQKQIWLNYTTEQKEKMSQKLSDISPAKKNVYIYKPDGELLGDFNSIRLASKDIGVDESYLSSAIHGNNYNAAAIKGYVPSFTQLTKDEVNRRYEHYLQLRKDAEQRTIEASKKDVYQFTIDGELVAKHKGITVAAESVNGLRQAVGNACYHRLGRKKTNVYKGYIWSFNNELQ